MELNIINDEIMQKNGIDFNGACIIRELADNTDERPGLLGEEYFCNPETIMSKTYSDKGESTPSFCLDFVYPINDNEGSYVEGRLYNEDESCYFRRQLFGGHDCMAEGFKFNSSEMKKVLNFLLIHSYSEFEQYAQTLEGYALDIPEHISYEFYENQ